MKILLTSIFNIAFVISCGYPDIDSVPDFKDVLLSDEEINDYCSNIKTSKKNVEKCINDYKSKN